MNDPVRHANLAGVPESATLGMTARAAALHTPERPVVSLSAGEPDFPTPAYISDAGIRAIREGHTYYPPVAGLMPLRKAIAEHLNEACGGTYAPADVLVSVGAKGALFHAIFTLFGPGDKVVVPSPYWVSYPPLVRLARAEPVVLETGPETGFQPAPDAINDALDRGARGVILNSPGNPTGAILDGAALDRILDAAAAHGAWVIADEIYMAIRYQDEFASVASRSSEGERIVLVNGFSKAYSMTGWRVGYAAGPAHLVAAMARLQGHAVTNTALPSQYAALAALTDRQAREAAIAEMVAAFSRRRATVLEALAELPGTAAHPPDGAFYVWIDAREWCAALGGGSDALCMNLLENERIALVPGSGFGMDGYVRLSFAASESVLEDGLERLAVAGRRLGGG